MKSAVKKLLVIAAIVLVFLLGFGIDAIIAQTYDIAFVAVARPGAADLPDENGQPIPMTAGVADGRTHVLLTVRLTRGGKPVEGHVLYIKTNRNVLARIKTDENGEALVDYTCYKARKRDKAENVTFTVTDEDNSVFITVSAKAEYELEMRKPFEDDSDGMKTDDVFYPIAEKGGKGYDGN